MPVKVLLYDDNAALLNSIKTLFQWNQEFDVVAAMPNTETILTDIELFKPDVIIMDIDLPPASGVKAVEQLRKNNQEIPVIMLTVFEDNDNIVNAIYAGASGYLLKKDIDQITYAIKDVLTGGAPMTSTVARKIMRLFAGKKPDNTQDNSALLTARELEILHWLEKGYSYKMIASELDVTIETVRSHIKRIYKKLHASNAMEAVYNAKLRNSH